MYKWHQKQWGSLTRRMASLPHALLLHGRAGIGKHDFAVSFAHALLCKQPIESGLACGQCQHCLWLQEGTHPDFKHIAPEDEVSSESATKKKTGKKSQISVMQIRQLYEYLSLSTHQTGGYRIILLSPAETLNTASANALLKMLEEPPPNTLFLLVASQPQRLLPTIISRCQSVDLPMPSKAEAVSWLLDNGVNEQLAEELLAYCGGAPLEALAREAQLETSQRLVQQLSLGGKLDPHASASLFLSLGMEQAVDALQKWSFDLLHVYLLAQVRYHLKLSKTFQALSKSVNLSALLQFQRDLTDVKKSANHPLSNEMQLENILLQYTRLFNV